MARAFEVSTSVEPHILGLIDPDHPEGAEQWGRHVHAHRPLGPIRFQWAPAMNATLDSVRPVIIDTQGLWMNLSRVALKRYRRRHTPLIVTPHGMLDPWALRQSALRKRLAGALFEDRHLVVARAVRALNEDEAKAIRRVSGSASIAVIPNGIEAPVPARVKSTEERAPTLQFLGRLDPKKGLEPLLRAWSLIKRQGAASDWQLKVNGWGNADYVASLDRLAADLGLDETFSLDGPIFDGEKDAALASASAFILPSYSEGLPMAVLEAWSWGTPALITRACNLPEGFAAGAAQEISTNPEELAGGIQEFIERSLDERRAMSDAARRLVETRFAARHVAIRLEQLYHWAAGGGEMPEGMFFD